MDNLVKQLKQFKTDAIYEKKKHYNAAERKRRYYKILSFTQRKVNLIHIQQPIIFLIMVKVCFTEKIHRRINNANT